MKPKVEIPIDLERVVALRPNHPIRIIPYGRTVIYVAYEDSGKVDTLILSEEHYADITIYEHN